MLRLVIIFGILAGFALLNISFPYVLHDNYTRYRAWSLVVILLVVAARVRPAHQTPMMLRNAALWLGIIAAMLLGYSFKDDLQNSRLAAAFFPRHIQITGNGSMRIHASSGGSFLIDGRVNGVPVLFLIDTGASDIVLSPSDAERIGLHPDRLLYNRSYSTANGYGQGATLTLKRLTVGNVTLDGVPASVNKTDMETSLLGMRFLHELKSFRFEGDTLILTP